ncbi:MAG: SO_0444 family Cu/Zn efflux transporter [Desulfovibrionaceae bacterium]|nr:SO_0444 family Cu/Zn efflux transporter [Desulfovibrionaceae bacterium]
MLELLQNILAESWNVLLESAPFMLLGFAVAGLLKALVPDSLVARHLGARPGRRSLLPVLKASLLGAPLPLCSCGVIPAAAGIRAQGASRGATAAFLISTPETGVDSVAVTYALLDPLMAVIRPVAAFLTATLAGLAIDATGPESERESAAHGEAGQAAAPRPPALEPLAAAHACTSCSCSGHACASRVPGHEGHAHAHGSAASADAETRPQLAVRLRAGMAYAFGDLLVDIGGWFLAGVLIAGAVSALVPAEFVARHLGSGFAPMLGMLALSVPLYVCATSSTPIAAALVLKGLSPGAALVFLLAGPATNAATILVVSRMLGRRAAVVYVAVIALVAVALGFAVEWLYGLAGMSAAAWAAVGDAAPLGPLSAPAAVLLVALILCPRLRRVLARRRA